MRYPYSKLQIVKTKEQQQINVHFDNFLCDKNGTSQICVAKEWRGEKNDYFYYSIQ